MDNSPRLFPKLQTFYLQHLGQEKKKKNESCSLFCTQLWINNYGFEHTPRLIYAQIRYKAVLQPGTSLKVFSVLTRINNTAFALAIKYTNDIS